MTASQARTDTTMAAVKGLAIILMVAGHAEGPWWMTNFIYLFHMPVFFMAAGYFFSEKYLDHPWDFVVRRIKGLYVPFLKWALLFLVLHNLLFHFGILNEQYGNWSGGVTHPYTPHQMAQRAVDIVFSMGGYDEFMAGAFWFFRALLLSSVAYLALRLLLGRLSMRLRNPLAASVTICLLALTFTAFKIGCGVRLVTVVQGGIRECWGVFFFSAGCLVRVLGSRVKLNAWWGVAIIAMLAVGAANHWAGMNLSPKLADLLTLPLTGIAGFLLLHHGCTRWLAPWLKGALAHCGSNTVYIYVFHIAAFKVVSALKIMAQGLDWGQIGCHMVIHDNAPGDGFWLLYTLAGVGLPLLWMALYRRLRPTPAIA